MKECTVCGTELRGKQRLYCGLQCSYKAYDKKFKQNNKERYLEIKRISYKNRKSDKRKEYNARKLINTNIKRKKIAHPSLLNCLDCGKRAEEYHHLDYNLPLYVLALCKNCHKIRHGKTQRWL